MGQTEDALVQAIRSENLTRLQMEEILDTLRMPVQWQWNTAENSRPILRTKNAETERAHPCEDGDL